MSSIKNLIKIITSATYRRERNINIVTAKELKRLFETEDNVAGESWLLGFKLKFTSGKSLAGLYLDIFERMIYKFQSHITNPLIIDGGSNIGLSIIYFKKIYPNAEIVGFEPDPILYNLLTQNIENSNLTNITLYNKALWSEDVNLSFTQDVSEAGYIETDSKTGIQVEGIRLSTYLKRKVNFLKLDIEGAELVVLKECANCLENVENIFVEYHSFIGKEQELDKVLAILRNAGFRIYLEHHGPYSKNPFLNIQRYKNMDMLVNIFGVRHSL